MQVSPALSPVRPTRSAEEPIAVYVHVPFCPTKCGYCDFNSYAMQGEIVERTVAAMVQEIRHSRLNGRPAKTIFFGGGTPTFLTQEQLLRIFEAVLEIHPPLQRAEITSEANPGTVDMPKFRAMRQVGFNRISLGAQSFLDDDLVRLGRVHRSGEIERAVEAARQAGFESLNLDLMFALPGQSRRAWEANLERALALQPEHLSLYCLTIEPNTAFYKLHLKGQLDLPDDDAQVEMYEQCVSRAAEAGFQQYEISNFAKPGLECRHNLCYWYGEEYVGYGPGAVGAHGGGYSNSQIVEYSDTRNRNQLKANRSIAKRQSSTSPLPPFTIHPSLTLPSLSVTRYTNLKHPERYCEAVEAGKPTAYEVEPLDEVTLRVERIMLGLRLNEGLPTDGLRLDGKAIQKLESRGWVEQAGDRLRLTSAGRHFCSEVALELI